MLWLLDNRFCDYYLWPFIAVGTVIGLILVSITVNKGIYSHFGPMVGRKLGKT